MQCVQNKFTSHEEHTRMTA